MKRIGLIIFFVCIIFLSFFIRKSYEGFFSTGAQSFTGTLFASTNSQTGNICFNKINNTFYAAVTGNGTIVAITLTGQTSVIMNTTKVISGTTTKFSAGDQGGPWGICADSEGNLYVTDQANSKIYKIPYSSITSTSCSPQLFSNNPSSATRPMGMACDSNNNIWVAFASGNSAGVYQYNSSGAVIKQYLGAGVMGVGIDKNNDVWYSYSTNQALYKNGSQVGSSLSTQHALAYIFDSNDNIFFVGVKLPGRMNYIASGANPSTNTNVYNSGAPHHGQGMCVDSSNNIYIAFSNGHITKLSASCKVGASYSPTGNPPCTPCPPTNSAGCPVNGTPTCQPNFELNSTTGATCDPKPCTLGVNFSVSGNQPCTACPANATCTTTRASGIVCGSNFTLANPGQLNAVCNPTPCTTGNYSTTGKAPCRTCPLNYATCAISGTPTCQTNTQYDSVSNLCAPIPCTPGSYSVSGNKPCTNCPTTNIGTCGTTGLPSCASGFVLDVTGTQCIRAPTTCPIGTYSPTGQSPAGSTTCPSQCPAGFTTIAAGSSNINQCVRPITRQDIITWLNTNKFNITVPTPNGSLPANAKYYGLQPNDLTNFPTTSVPTVAHGSTYTGTLASIEPLLNPSITSAALKNYANKSLASMTNSYYLTNSQGEAVNGSNASINYPMTNIPFTQGSRNAQKRNIVSCSSMTDPTSCTYRWAGINGPPSANPCPALNSWFDFDKESCVDALGKSLTTLNVCPSTSIYDKPRNACVPVRKPLRSMPPNTTGKLGDDDYNNCKSIDQGDCTPLYKLGSNVSTTNPCSGSTPNYNFETNTCVGNPCCSLTPSQASTNSSCSQYVQTTNTPNQKCTNTTTSIARTCCKPENAARPQCATYYTKLPSFRQSHSNLCGTSGFEDYGTQFVLTGPPRKKYF